MRFYLRFIWIPVMGGLFTAQSWMGMQWQGFTHVKSGIVVFCLATIGLMIARPWLETDEPSPPEGHYEGVWPGWGRCGCDHCYGADGWMKETVDEI